MIAMVKMFPKAPGLRPTASAALAPTKPTPFPPPPPAKARGKVAAMFPPWAASANIGSSSNVIIFVFSVSLGCFLSDTLAAHALGWSRQEIHFNGPLLLVRHG